MKFPSLKWRKRRVDRQDEFTRAAADVLGGLESRVRDIEDRQRSAIKAIDKAIGEALTFIDMGSANSLDRNARSIRRKLAYAKALSEGCLRR